MAEISVEVVGPWIRFRAILRRRALDQEFLYGDGGRSQRTNFSRARRDGSSAEEAFKQTYGPLPKEENKYDGSPYQPAEFCGSWKLSQRAGLKLLLSKARERQPAFEAFVRGFCDEYHKVLPLANGARDEPDTVDQIVRDPRPFPHPLSSRPTPSLTRPRPRRSTTSSGTETDIYSTPGRNKARRAGIAWRRSRERLSERCCVDQRRTH